MIRKISPYPLLIAVGAFTMALFIVAGLIGGLPPLTVLLRSAIATAWVLVATQVGLGVLSFIVSRQQ